jgi:hypothetical protein
MANNRNTTSTAAALEQPPAFATRPMNNKKKHHRPPGVISIKNQQRDKNNVTAMKPRRTNKAEDIVRNASTVMQGAQAREVRPHQQHPAPTWAHHNHPQHDTIVLHARRAMRHAYNLATKKKNTFEEEHGRDVNNMHAARGAAVTKICANGGIQEQRCFNTNIDVPHQQTAGRAVRQRPGRAYCCEDSSSTDKRNDAKAIMNRSCRGGREMSP